MASEKHRILCVVGTRPEAIKMAPVISALKNHPAFDVRVLASAQHRDLLDQVLSLFGIKPDYDLNIMRENQALTELTARLLLSIEHIIDDVKPAAVLAQGDTTTVMASALCSFYKKTPFCHVEAGLRTGDMQYPFPEEMNRVVAGHLAALHFAPTDGSRNNLLKEGISNNQIFVTGNTVIDSLLEVADKKIPLGIEIDHNKKMILVTIHRREIFGDPFIKICRAILQIAEEREDVTFLYPVHPNPNIYGIAHAELSGHPRIIMTPPLDYGQFVTAMSQAHIILTDSGGVQEEAPALGKPVLVLRDETERPEAVDAGVVMLVGPNRERIISEVYRLLDDSDAYKAMSKGASPYGDGKASGRIVEALLNFLA